MPQINRIRIINFSYNNDKRHIVDERFDFYKGENALLSLKNGGGKSVLVQLIMQPIIPMVKIQGRKFQDFFKKKKTPTFALIEWKLESEGGYLLTGICIANRETTTRDNQDQENTIKYFTFTVSYNKGNICDIYNIPFCRKVDSNISILSFKDASDFLLEKSRDRVCDVKYFAQDDKMRYNQELLSYNISPEEWKNVIARINSDEGGVIEIFEKCKTSQQLMREWMIKTVETVIFNDQKGKNKLEEMLENLIDEMIENEQYIYEKITLDDFKTELGDIIDKINNLMQNFDRQTEIENKLIMLHKYLVIQIETLKAKIQDNNELINENYKKKAFIDIEERSNDYYVLTEKYEIIKNEHEEIKQEFDNMSLLIDETLHKINILKAAGLSIEINEISAALAFIEEEIKKLKGEAIDQEKIRNLEYTLKYKYSKLNEESNDKINQNEMMLKTIEESIHKLKEKITKSEREITALNHKISFLGAKTETFLIEEKKLKQEIGFNLNRNLFGEADRKDIENAKNSILEKENSLQKQKVNLQNEVDAKNARQIDLQNENEALQEKEIVNAGRISLKEQEKKTYYEREEELRVIYSSYDFDFNKKHSHEAMNQEFKNLVEKYYQSHNEFNSDLQNIDNTISSLKDGTLHVSEKFSVYLNDNDINYETGENYLRKRQKTIRDELLQNLPLLPFSFILTDEEIKKVKSKFDGKYFYNLIPIISYDTLNAKFQNNRSLVEIGNGASLICLYNQKMISAENIDDYLGELQNQRATLAQKVKHYKNAYEQAKKDMDINSSFVFSARYIGELESSIALLIKEKNGIVTRKKDISDENISIEKEKKNFLELLEKIIVEIVKIESYKSKFAQFLTANLQYEADVKDIAALTSQQTLTTNENNEAMKTRETEISKKTEMTNARIYMQFENVKHKDGLARYENASDGELLEGDVKNLESILSSLKNKIEGDLARIEKDKESKHAEISRKSSEMGRLNITPEEYDGTIYNELILKQFEKDFEARTKEKKIVEKQERELSEDKAIAKTNTENALNEVLKIPSEVIPKEDIKLNFKARRDACDQGISDMKAKTREYEGENTIYIKASDKIAEIVDTTKRLPVSREYESDVDIKTYFDLTLASFFNIKKSNSEEEKHFNILYNRTMNKFKEKNTNLDNIIKGLESLKEQAALSPDNYFYFYERAVNQRDMLSDMIKIYEIRLANLEKNKYDMIVQSHLHSMQLYEEVAKITKDSAIKLSGRTAPVSMLKIDMEDPKDKEQSMDKMKAYIETRIQDTKDDLKKEKSKEEIKRNINKYMSSWELLNVISNLDKLVVRAYKIDINANNSQYKTWEQVMKENSGGERFVSFFAVLAALMSYSRTSQKTEDEYIRNKDTKVLLMDNPFGPISSEHLLKPLFEIAKKYQTQLICLTDLKQNSILNCFDLIYMIKIRTNTFGTNEYLKVEEEKREGVDMENDENLEKAVFRVDDYTQVELF